MKKQLDHSKLQECLETLKLFAEDRENLTDLSEELRVELFKTCGLISRPPTELKRQFKNELKVKKKREKIKHNKEMRKLTGIRSARENAVFVAPKLLAQNEQHLDEAQYAAPRECYVCRDKFTTIHHFYDSMCPKCGDLNYFKRFQRTDMTGQVAIITGARLKIGYHAAIMMLQSGATVVVTTRFPVDAAIRYAKEPDYNQWSDRLQIYGLDLRHTPSVDLFAKHIEEKYHRLDILINNAAQTVRRPSGFYTHLMENERLLPTQLDPKVLSLLQGHFNCVNQLQSHNTDDKNLPVSWQNKAPGIGMRASAELSQIPYTFDHSLDVKEVFPEGKLDADLQQVDLRTTNSWRLKVGEIPVAEMIEVQLVNSIAPFVLINRLVGLMKSDYTGQKHIVNVSAMEGKFQRFKKESRHPHTNMAKAALNMLSHTAAQDLAKEGIYINAVDTGWVTDEDPVQLAKAKQQIHDFQPPLDIVDGAARVCDPFIDGINTGKHWNGKFLKDYFPIDW